MTAPVRTNYRDHNPVKVAEFIRDNDLEGLYLTPYYCPAGKLTIGFGHTGADVQEGMRIDEHHAWILLIADCERHAAAFAPYVQVPVSEAQYIALTSLVFNVGVNYVVKNCPKLMSALNRGDYAACAHEFLDIIKAGGKVLPGLVKRRRLEATLMREEIAP